MEQQPWNRYRIARQVGNTLIAVSILGFWVIFYPIIKSEIAFRLHADVTNLRPPNTQFGLVIPSIGVSAPVIANVDAFNPVEYERALRLGVAQAKGTATPDTPGTTYLFAHSSEAPWLQTANNTAFYRLTRLKTGNRIFVWYMGKQYTYTVTDLKTVWPNEVEYLTQSTNTQLILQTCVPIGTDWQRLLVFAAPVNN